MNRKELIEKLDELNKKVSVFYEVEDDKEYERLKHFLRGKLFIIYKPDSNNPFEYVNYQYLYKALYDKDAEIVRVYIKRENTYIYILQLGMQRELEKILDIYDEREL